MKRRCSDLGNTWRCLEAQQASGKGHQGMQAESRLWAEKTACGKAWVQMTTKASHLKVEIPDWYGEGYRGGWGGWWRRDGSRFA